MVQIGSTLLKPKAVWFKPTLKPKAVWFKPLLQTKRGLVLIRWGLVSILLLFLFVLSFLLFEPFKPKVQTPKFHEKKERQMWRERKKARNVGAHRSGPYPDTHQIGKNGWAKNRLAKIGLAEIGQIRMKGFLREDFDGSFEGRLQKGLRGGEEGRFKWVSRGATGGRVFRRGGSKGGFVGGGGKREFEGGLKG